MQRAALTSLIVTAIGLGPALNAGQTGTPSVQYRSPAGVEYRSLPDTDAIRNARAALAAEPKNISRVIDLLLAFPELLLAIMIAAVLGGGFWNIVAVLTVAFIPGFARVARASTLGVKQEPFVEAAVAVGVSTPVIIPDVSATPVVVMMRMLPRPSEM